MSNTQNTFLTWVEISKSALLHNLKMIRKCIGSKVILAPSVKANAYGHSMVQTSKIVLENGADWLCVNALFEAKKLRRAGIKKPIYIMGYVINHELKDAVKLNCKLVVYNKETIRGLAKEAKKLRKKISVHIKVETGNNRQGVPLHEVLHFARYIQKFKNINLEGIATHFANIEDTTDYSYAKFQLENFKKALLLLEKAGVYIPFKHCANSAASLLFSETHFDMVRPGISVFGLWPSAETKLTALKKKLPITLKPVLSWKTRIAQIKEVPKGDFIGYGCTYRTKKKTRIAILPVGYYEGYNRSLSNKSYVLIHGKTAPLCGRVCMNIIMVDVTNIPEARVEDPVTLIGRDGDREISADYLAELAGTINYEITTRIHEGIARVIVE